MAIIACCCTGTPTTGDACCTGHPNPSPINVNFNATLIADPARWQWDGPAVGLSNGDYALTGDMGGYSQAPGAIAMDFRCDPFDSTRAIFTFNTGSPGLDFSMVAPLSITCVPVHWLITGQIKQASGVLTHTNMFGSPGFQLPYCLFDLTSICLYPGPGSPFAFCDFELNITVEITP